MTSMEVITFHGDDLEWGWPHLIWCDYPLHHQISPRQCCSAIRKPNKSSSTMTMLHRHFMTCPQKRTKAYTCSGICCISQEDVGIIRPHEKNDQKIKFWFCLIFLIFLFLFFFLSKLKIDLQILTIKMKNWESKAKMEEEHVCFCFYLCGL